MKKTYTKPYIAVESFQLDAAIAAACSTTGYIPINYGEDSCGYEEMGPDHWQFFNFRNCEVDLSGPGDDGTDGFYYHGPFVTPEMFIAS